MIDEKKIAKIATLYAKETWNHEEEQFVAMCAFKEGTLWAQQEFINSLWHDASEEPKKCKMVLLCDKKGSILTVMSPIHSTGFAYEKWCYLSDVLPKEGGEK